MKDLMIDESQFSKVNLQTAKQWYKMGWLQTTAYLLIIFDLKKDPSWNWQIESVKEFCEFFGIEKASFYRATTTLEKEGFLTEECKQQHKIGKHRLFNPDLKEKVSHRRDKVSRMRHSLTNETQSHGCDKSLTDATKVSPMRHESHGCENEGLKTAQDKDSGTLPDIIQNYPRLSPLRGEDEKINSEPEEQTETGQEEETAKDLNQVQAIITQPVQNPIASFKSSEAALTRSSTPDPFFSKQPQQRHEFLEFDEENTPWLNPPRRKNDIHFKPEFMQWQGARWMQKFQKRDIYEAIADFKSSLINEPDRIPGRWEEYVGHMSQHAVNLQNRIEAGGTVFEDEQAKMLTHLPNVASALNQTQTAVLEAGETRALAPAITVNAIPVPQTESHAENHGAYRVYTPPADTTLTPEEIAENCNRLAEMTRKLMEKKRMPQPQKEAKEASTTPKNLTQAREMMLDPVLRQEAVRWANTNGYQVDLESLEILEF